MKPGLVSITFRRKSPAEIIGLARQAGLAAIEWGGDVHVPHGDTTAAAQVRNMTQDAGLSIAAYGSYFRAGEHEPDGPSFTQVLDTAEALGARQIRVWAGRKSAKDANETYRNAVQSDLQRIAGRAANRDIRICLEYHANTLTDTNESAAALLNALPPGQVDTFWQPLNNCDPDVCLHGLQQLRERVRTLHVFHWTFPDGRQQRHPLAEGRDCWLRYLHAARQAPHVQWALLEFVRNESTEQFLEDAETLKQWLHNLHSQTDGESPDA